MTWWIVGYALVGIAVAVMVLSKFTPLRHDGDVFPAAAAAIFMVAVWPLAVAGWLLVRAAEAVGKRR